MQITGNPVRNLHVIDLKEIHHTFTIRKKGFKENTFFSKLHCIYNLYYILEEQCKIFWQKNFYNHWSRRKKIAFLYIIRQNVRALQTNFFVCEWVVTLSRRKLIQDRVVSTWLYVHWKKGRCTDWLLNIDNSIDNAHVNRCTYVCDNNTPWHICTQVPPGYVIRKLYTLLDWQYCIFLRSFLCTLYNTYLWFFFALLPFRKWESFTGWVSRDWAFFFVLLVGDVIIGGNALVVSCCTKI